MKMLSSLMYEVEFDVVGKSVAILVRSTDVYVIKKRSVDEIKRFGYCGVQPNDVPSQIVPKPHMFCSHHELQPITPPYVLIISVVLIRCRWEARFGGRT